MSGNPARPPGGEASGAARAQPSAGPGAQVVQSHSTVCSTVSASPRNCCATGSPPGTTSDERCRRMAQQDSNSQNPARAFLRVSTTPVKQVREALGARLREIRADANLTGRALAAVCEWHFTKISKFEHGAQAPSEQDIRAWCRACNAEDHVPDLIATVRAIESMYVEWQRHMRAGLKRSQTASVPLYERTKLFRGYENTVIPGLFHTAEYAAAIFRFWNEFLDLPNDVDEAVAARMERQRIL